tara:strand:+ start:170 stop:694 length:525 start_codon:yes stop_codon:yes gene_type:complete
VVDFSVDWKKIRTMSVWGSPVLIISLASWLWTFYGRVEVLEASFQEHMEWSNNQITQGSNQRKNMSSKIDYLIDMMEMERVRQLTVVGRGSPGTFGRDSSFVRINRQSSRIRYQDGERVKVTVLSGRGETSLNLPINGTFSNANNDLIVIFSSKACDELGISEPVEVKLEPVEG